MTQSTILAAGLTAATSTQVVVAPGGSVTIGLFVASGKLPNTDFAVQQVTPGLPARVGTLNQGKPIMAITAPGTYQVFRDTNTAGVPVGVFLEAT